jgi:hypothetical protein
LSHRDFGGEPTRVTRHDYLSGMEKKIKLRAVKGFTIHVHIDEPVRGHHCELMYNSFCDYLEAFGFPAWALYRHREGTTSDFFEYIDPSGEKSLCHYKNHFVRNDKSIDVHFTKFDW